MNGGGSAPSIRATAARAASGTTSRRVTGTPALARWAAMPLPMTPAPITAARRISMASHRLQDGRDALAAADAHRRQRQRLALPPEDRGRLAGDPGAAGAERVPERDRA